MCNTHVVSRPIDYSKFTLKPLRLAKKWRKNGEKKISDVIMVITSDKKKKMPTSMRNTKIFGEVVLL